MNNDIVFNNNYLEHIIYHISSVIGFIYIYINIMMNI